MRGIEMKTDEMYECDECGERIPINGVAFMIKNYCRCKTCQAELDAEYDRYFARTKYNHGALDNN
jgi:hypothetical protein